MSAQVQLDVRGRRRSPVAARVPRRTTAGEEEPSLPRRAAESPTAAAVTALARTRIASIWAAMSGGVMYPRSRDPSRGPRLTRR